MAQANSLYGLLAEQARAEPDASAHRYRGEQLTYGDWERLAGRLSGKLASLGVRRGDVVALLLPTTPFYQIAYLAAARLGAVTTGINVRYRRIEMGHILRRSGAKVLIAVDEWHDADFKGMIEPQRGELPELEHVLWVTADELRTSSAATVERLAGSTPVPPPAEVAPSDPVAIVFTSGTTGVPKGAWYAHESLFALADIERRRVPPGRHPSRVHLVTGIAFAHVGMMARIGIQIGNRVGMLIHDAFDPAAVLEAIERERLGDIGGFPTQVVMLLDHPDRPKRDLSSLESVLLGGAPATPALIRRIQETLGVEVVIRYSSTEVGIATGSAPGDPPEILSTTVGRPSPGVELRVVGDDGQSVPTGEVGGVIIRSPATMRGYWRDEEQTRAVLDADGWVHTGDLGSLDEQGYLRLQGRRSEMYIRGGFNVHPIEIEALLARHPKVAKAAVVGVPHDVLGEVGWAFIVPKEESSPPTLAELRTYVGESMASFKRPDGLTLLPDLPVTPMFKVDKRALRDLHPESSS